MCWCVCVQCFCVCVCVNFEVCVFLCVWALWIYGVSVCGVQVCVCACL